MILELSLFLVEVFGTLAYPALMTLKALSSGDHKGHGFQSWTFYWIAFVLVNGACWTLDFFPFPYLRPLALLALALPQLGLSWKASQFVMGPLQDIILENLNKGKDLVKAKLG
jgi:hypothetical protein